jgi:DNA polymerase
LSDYRAANNYKTVPGAGNANAEVMIIGEAPGENEAKQGLPFVGKAGNMLNNILQAIGLKREEIFIANMVKCRPPGNRDPEVIEVNNCRKFLDLQIKCVDPKWIICLGRISSIHLLGHEPNTTMAELRGKLFEYQDRKVICTYHPAYLLRNPKAKEDVWNDLQPIVTALQSVVPIV